MSAYAGRAEAAALPVAAGKIAFAQHGADKGHDEQLGDAVPVLHGIRGVALVDKRDKHFAAVVGVDEPYAVGKGPALRGWPAPNGP